MEEYYKAGQATDENIIGNRKDVISKPYDERKYTSTHS